MNEFNNYQAIAAKTAIYPGSTLPLNHIQRERVLDLAGPMYLGLKLAGEAGEVAEKIGKAIRDGIDDEVEFRRLIGKELGDVLWYVSQIAREFGYQFADIAAGNIDKLESRQARGVLSGSGDER